MNVLRYRVCVILVVLMGVYPWQANAQVTTEVAWQRCLGGSGTDWGSSLTGTSDGGFVAVGWSASIDGDAEDNHGGNDMLVVRLDANGGVLWRRSFGGSSEDMGYGCIEASDGSIMVAGSTLSNDGDIPLNQGASDVLLARISSSGSLLWTRTYGGSGDDDCRSLASTDDGGFLLAGSSDSVDGDVTSNLGERDVWVLKVDANGAIIWQRSFGGTLDEWAFMEKGEQGGYLLTGLTHSNDGAIAGNHGDRDLWLAKINDQGDLLWQRCLGGSSEDWGYLQAQTSDGGYVAFGYTDSNDGDVSGNHGQRDIWVVKLKVYEPPEPLECVLYIPTALSPDNSAKNDKHCLYGTDCIKTMTMGIYDRWGNKVFESKDPNACWDGAYNGQPLDPAVFVYHLIATMNNGDSMERQGNITLVR